ncbi:unnamed protein product [Nesidiocoris tenuis]|uniref:F-ATPase gamma subunit n=1 Tax=Nesidiocoris tenuis TaxID=355587 RepID=A0A6H5GSE7_9HEMI|nr:unnamed protein product [Nesidiocoris tenuis]
MAGNLRQIQLQSKSIKNIQKLTNSMKMVAATRFKQAERLLLNSRPLGVGSRKFYDLVGVGLEPKTPVHYLVPFTSDRGLCGSCHYRTCKLTTSRMKERKQEYRVVCVGEKAKMIIGFTNPKDIRLVVNGIGHRNPTFRTASRISLHILGLDKFQECTFYFTHFVGAMSFEVKQLKVYSSTVMEKSQKVESYEMEDSFESYVEFSLAALVFYALSESFSVELFSRMNAMAAASKNAGNLHKALTGKFNSARQSLITRDLIDIVSGASVVAPKKKKARMRTIVQPEAAVDSV